MVGVYIGHFFIMYTLEIFSKQKIKKTDQSGFKNLIDSCKVL